MATATARYPGSINVLGEHSLVFANNGAGGHGIRLAVNKFLKVALSPCKSSYISVTSRLGEETATRDKLSNPFVRTALAHYGIEAGLAINIDDDLPETVGLGSSAALSTALAQALSRYRDNLDLGNDQLFVTARTIMRQAQGNAGSGIDVAGSVYTGCVALNAADGDVEPLPAPPAISMLYSGSKMPTPAVLAKVEAQHKPQHFFDAMESLTKQGIEHARNNDWQSFGKIMYSFQDYMVELDLNTPELDQLQRTLAAASGVYGAKIAGAGLGDSVIAIGTPDHNKALSDNPAFIDIQGYSDDNRKAA